MLSYVFRIITENLEVHPTLVPGADRFHWRHSSHILFYRQNWQIFI